MIDFSIAKLAATIIRPIWNKIKKIQEKKDFIKKIKDIIEESERQIQEAVPLIPFEGAEPHASEHEVRFALYKKMMEEFEGFLGLCCMKTGRGGVGFFRVCFTLFGLADRTQVSPTPASG